MIELRAALADPLLESMNFLNEITLRFPHAISFGPGRPDEKLFDTRATLGELERFLAKRCGPTGKPSDEAWDRLAQYGRTKGIVHEEVARQLALDENLRVNAEHVVITNGCQEAMLIVLLTLFEPAVDVLLCSDPAYQGMTAAARLLGIAVEPVPTSPDGVRAAEVARRAAEIRAKGLRPRALYVIPDFDNPSGTMIPLEERQRLVAVAADCDLVIIEDTPYRPFHYEGHTLPTLKSLGNNQVILLGTYAKTIFPGLRVGYAVADLPARVGMVPQPIILADAMARVKSNTSVNTSPLMQAVLGGLLEANGGTLAVLTKHKIAHYREARDRLLAALEREFGSYHHGVAWNRPLGGFFVTLALTHPFTLRVAEQCAETHGVIVCPMGLFSVGPCEHKKIRLSFSSVAHESIDEGVTRLASFVRSMSQALSTGSP